MMPRRKFICLSCAAVALGISGTLFQWTKVRPVSTQARQPALGIAQTATRTPFPLTFEPNIGQTDPSVHFLTRTRSGVFYFRPSEVVFVTREAKIAAKDEPEDGITQVNLRQSREVLRAPTVTRLRFVGANASPAVTGGEILPGKINRLVGNNPERWQRNIETYAQIFYANLYSGVDLSYGGANGNLKSTFTVGAGTDPSCIRWRYDGSAGATVDQGGNLHIALAQTKDGAEEMVEEAPIAWQEIAGERVSVAAHYVIGLDGTVSFGLGSYDRAHPVTIDPTLSYSTCFGGTGVDQAWGLAVDGAGNSYITGGTTSANFPTTAAYHQKTPARRP